MKEAEDFGKIGKKIPYRVPREFFGGITERTLEKAIRRRKQNKIRLIRSSLAVAATLLLLVTVGYLLFQPGSDPASVAESKKPVPVKDGSRVAIESDKIAEKKVPDQSIEVKHPAEVQNDPVSTENLDSLLALLTDEELKFFSGLISAEITIEDFHKNLRDEN